MSSQGRVVMGGVFAVVCAALVGCGGGKPASSGRAPEVVPGGTLSLLFEEPDATRLQVISAGPLGQQSDQDLQINLVFSKPLRALGLAEDEAPPAITITPALQGAWTWVGTSALTFVPKPETLRAATPYRVTVPAGLRALDGTVHERPFTFEFETPRPEVAGFDLVDAEHGLTPRSSFTVRFNQEVTPAALAKVLSLTAAPLAGGTAVAVPVRIAEPTAERDESTPALRVVPEQPLPLASTITLRVGENLTSVDGPLGSNQPFEYQSDTYDRLSVRFECSTDGEGCVGRPQLHFSNPLPPKALAGALRVLQLDRLVVESYGGDEGPSEVFELAGRYQRGVRYRVQLRAGVQDIHGQTLRDGLEHEFTMGQGTPLVQLGVLSGFVEPSLGTEAVLASANVAAFEALWSVLTPEQVLAYRRAGFPEALTQVSLQREPVRPKPGLNLQHDHRIPFARALGQRGGALLVGHSGLTQEAEDWHSFQVVHPTDLGVSTRLSARGGLAWVTRLSDGRPVPGATLRWVGSPDAGARHATDTRGLVRLSEDAVKSLVQARDEALLVAEVPGDWSYAGVHALEPYEHRQLVTFSTERGVYRPGEEVYLKGWARKEASLGTIALANRPVVAELKDGESSVSRAELTSNAFGGFHATLKVPSFARLGHYTLEVSVDGRGEWGSIQVGEYRPAEFETTVELAQKEHRRGEPISARLRGSYLFGGPMKGASVELHRVSTPEAWTLPGAETFQTDAWQHARALEAVLGHAAPPEARQRAVLDEHGALERSFDSALELLGPARVQVVATVQDVSRQAVTGSANTLVHPGEFYLGVEVPEGEARAGGRLRPKVIAARADGTRLSGHGVRLELYRYTDGHHRWRRGEKVEKRGSCQVVTKETPVSCPLSLDRGGHHFVLARALDAQKNPLFAADDLYVDAFVPEQEANDAVTLELDREQYGVGDTAIVTVTSPVPDADVLLTLEQEAVMWSDVQRAKGRRARFAVPVTENIANSATLTALVARGSKPARPAPGEDGYRPWGSGPAMLSGTALLRLDQSFRRLRVKVLPEQAHTAPGAKVKVRFEVVDGLGRPHAAELAVAAVDEGVLALTDYRQADPFDAFLVDRDNMVRSSDTRDGLGWLFRPRLEEQLGVPGSGFGAGHGRLGGSHRSRAPKVRMGATKVSREEAAARGDFRTTPYWNPSIVTDAEGRAEVTVGLSQLLTRYRIAVVASGRDDYFGTGESAIETRVPLMVRPALPRFSRVGDRFEAGVVISSSEVDAENATVTVAAKGVTLRGPAQQSLAIRRGESKEVLFSFQSDAPGSAALEFRVKAGSHADAVNVTLPIHLPLSPQAVALYGKTSGVRGEALGDLGGATPHFGELAVSTSSTALVGLEEGVDQLVDYPYGCTEQLSSRLLPLLPLRDLAKDFGIQLPSDVPAEIQGTVSKILARQRHDGGFGLWDDDPESHPWLSAYVLRTLDEAQKRGEHVPESTLTQVFDYLHRYSKEQLGDAHYRPTLAFIAYVFAEHGRPSRVALERLMVDDQDDPPFVQALTLQALTRLRAQRKEEAEKATADGRAWARRIDGHIEKLTKALESELRLNGNRAFVEGTEGQYSFLFDSTTRTNAMVLSALLEANPKHPLAEAMARGLLAARRGGSWRSTQETAYALLALDSYRRKQETRAPNFDAVVWLDQAELGRAQYRGRSTEVQGFTLPMSKLPRDGSVLAFRKEGEGTLFYQALLRYSPKTLPVAALDHGLAVEQRLHTVQGGTLPEAVAQGYAPSERSFAAGAAVLVQVTVSTPTERDFVVIESPLPAGLEPIDTSFAIHADEGLPDATGGAWGRGWSRRELRDDRVLFFMNRMAPGLYRFSYLARATSTGQFVMPPANAQQMYAPEVFGRTGALTIDVVR